MQNQILRLEWELKETKEAAKESQDWMGAKPLAIKATPRPLPKANPIPAPSAPLVAWANPTRAPPAFAQPTPVWAPPQVHTPPPPLPIRLCSPQFPQPAAPVAAYPTPVKVDHPDAYTGKIGNKARQWLTRMLAWDGVLGCIWQPGCYASAERQITNLTQTGTCAEYITKFRTIAMDLDWNNAALCGQFACGLHWEVSRLIATQEQQPTTLLELQNAALVIDNALHEERASHPPKGNKSGASTTNPNRGASTGQLANQPGRLSSNPNFVSKEERNRCRAEGLCIKCGKAGHKFAECRTGWKATPKEDGVKKEAAKVGKESGPKLGKD
ncbi:hypothetical protein RHS01_08390 [Rhizoctonia solani]|uniref:CCHC-type domain-containing protein n=1 Tax=Rhizoctonia solani TaxID=456999 RepID=A0A8H7I5K9_9AGAM|nr:hypothetical protein RHS01_08390 [Rhizoctonia solani]